MDTKTPFLTIDVSSAEVRRQLRQEFISMYVLT